MTTSVFEQLSAPLRVDDSPGLETVDPRFTEISDLVGRQDHGTVIDRVQALVAEGVYDIRLITQYMFARFEGDGVVCLPAVFSCLEVLLGPNFEAIGPKLRREQHVAKSIARLCETMTDRVAYHASKKDGRWQAWLTEDRECLRSAIEALDRVGERLAGPTYGETAQVVGHLARWLRELDAAHEQEATAASADASGGPHASIGGVAISVADDSTRGSASGRSVAPPPPAMAGGAEPGGSPWAESITLRGSYQLRTLLQKLDAFETLIAAGKFDRAALVCDDLHEVMDNFDPREYFPELFATFGRLLTEHIAELEVQWQYRDSAMWNAMRQFSRVDLQAFVDRD